MSGKRCFDLAAAAALLVLLAPVLAVIAIGVRVGGRPVLFRQIRVGQYGRQFTILKFRTMRSGPGPLVTVHGDDRITRLGGLLRRLKLDELPQLVNVLLGDMSLVGWRPEVPAVVDQMRAAYEPLLAFPAGVTDPSSIRFRHESALLRDLDDPMAYYLAEILPIKVSLSLDYARRASRRSDLTVLVRTVAR